MRKFLLLLLILILGVVSLSDRYVIDILIENILYWEQNDIKYNPNLYNKYISKTSSTKNGEIEFMCDKKNAIIALKVELGNTSDFIKFFTSNDFVFDESFIDGFFENKDKIISTVNQRNSYLYQSDIFEFESFGGEYHMFVYYYKNDQSEVFIFTSSDAYK
ncbi:hypothetical protein [Oceanotoga teriensis]|uniref:hypothetical protein n=1 Tax=Oceanotoga teriensis TaxID=515440 RepID=UPI002713B15A|nr:hypothetical protein [Oceanotoga teriensis]MDO7976745.1 hypothetical protein [Oceanotoga teriensis]